MTTRRNFFIRTVATLVGDIAIAAALASACAWLINTAALGLFLSFLVWLIGTLLALAASQYLLHPSLQFMLSDQKLDDAIHTASGLCSAFGVLGEQGTQRVWSAVKGGLSGLGSWGGFASRFKPA